VPPKDADDNAAYCRAYRSRLKSDPKKTKELRDRRREYMRKYRARPRAKPVVTPATQPVVTEPEPVVTQTPPVVTPVVTDRPPVVTGIGLGGKHSPSKTDSGTVIPVEDRIEAWQERRHKDEAIEERKAIMEFDGGIDPEVLEAFFMDTKEAQDD